jgi:hypothetical protein
MRDSDLKKDNRDFAKRPLHDGVGGFDDLAAVCGLLLYARNIELPDGKRFNPKVPPCLYYGRYTEES